MLVSLNLTSFLTFVGRKRRLNGQLLDFALCRAPQVKMEDRLVETRNHNFFRVQGVYEPRKTVIYKPTKQEQQGVVAYRGTIQNDRQVSNANFAVSSETAQSLP